MLYKLGACCLLIFTNYQKYYQKDYDSLDCIRKCINTSKFEKKTTRHYVSMKLEIAICYIIFVLFILDIHFSANTNLISVPYP